MVRSPFHHRETTGNLHREFMGMIERFKIVVKSLIIQASSRLD
jgi:hypothetical protein